MKNPIKQLGLWSSMSHTDFQRTMVSLEKAGRDSSAGGKDRIGHFVRSNGTVRASTDGTRGSRRTNNAAIKDLICYLEKYPDRFEPGKAKKALSGIKAVRGMTDIDMAFLAQDVKDLVPREVLAFDFAGGRTKVRKESNEVWMAAHLAANGSSPTLSFDSPDQVKANEQAMKKKVIVSGQKFATACLPGFGQRHPKDAKRLVKSLSAELAGSDLTRAIGVERLAGLVEEAETRFTAQKDELEALLAQKDRRDQDPAFHEELKLLGEKIMKSQSNYLHTLSLVANRLNDRDLRQLPPDFSLVMARFAEDLVDFLKAQLAPGSLFLQTNRLAAESKALAERRMAELKAPGPAIQTRSSDELHAQAVTKAKTAYAAFEDACFKPQGGSNGLSRDQMQLRQEIGESLLAHDATTRLPLSAVKGNLFEFVPGRIRELKTELTADVTAWTESPNAVLLSRIQSKAQELIEQISAHLAQLDVVSRILLTKPAFGDLPPELDAARVAAGDSMLQLKHLLEDPNGERMSVQASARQALQLGRPKKVQHMAGDTRPDRNEDHVDESSLLPLIPLAEPKTKPAFPLAALVSPATYDETAFSEEVDRMEAQLLAELGQLPSAMPVPQEKQPAWLTELPPGESQQLTKPVRSSQQLNRPQDAFLSSGDTNAFEEMLEQMDIANVSLAMSGGRGQPDREESLDPSFGAEGAKRADEEPYWRLAGRPYGDPSGTKRLAAGRAPNAVRMDKAADAFTENWEHFVKKCLVPADGLHGLSDHQRLVKSWWAGVLPKTSYDPTTHNADADMPLAYLDPGSLADVFVTEWPRNLEARRQALKDLLLLKDRLKNRGADVHRQLDDRIREAANSLERDLDRFLAQVNTLAKGLIERKEFPVNVPAGFKLATSDAGKSLMALSDALKAPTARTRSLIQDARERSAVAR